MIWPPASRIAPAMALLPFRHRPIGKAVFHTTRAMHNLLLLAVGMLALTSLLLAGAAWRLAQGPIQIGWLAHRLSETLASGPGATGVTIGEVELVWDGFRRGTGNPLDLRATDIRVTDAEGRLRAVVPAAHLGLSLSHLIMGQIVPNSVDVDKAQVFVTREPNGTVNFGWVDDDPDTGRENTASTAVPAIVDQIQHIRFRDTLVVFRDRATGLSARAEGADIDLSRTDSDRIGGTVRAPLVSGGQEATLNGALTFVRGGDTTIAARLSAVVPGQIPGIPAALAGIDVPVSLSATAMLDAQLKPVRLRTTLEAGEGQIAFGTGTLPVRRARMELSGTPDLITIERLHLDLAAAPSGDPEALDITGSVTRAANRLTASLFLKAGRIDLADLPKLWPPGTGGGARPWITQNVPVGIATGLHMSLSAESGDDFNDVVLTRAEGEGDVTNVAFTWIDNVPPVEHAKVHLHLIDPDTLDITVAGGRQRIRGGGAELLASGQMRIVGLSVHDQVATIQTDVTGPLVSVMTMLKEPRLRLLSTHPIGLKPNAGEATAAMAFTVPLENRLTIDDVGISADVHLHDAAVPNVVADRNLTAGSIDLKVDKDGLSLKGSAMLAAIPVGLDGIMDFRAGGPDQVTERLVVTGRPTAVQLEAAGVPVGDVITGPVDLTATVVERRNGDGAVAIAGDLTQSVMKLSPLAWTKPDGARTRLTANLSMVNDRLTKIGGISLEGDDISVNASADAPGGHVPAVTLRDIRLGRTRAAGEIRLGANGAIGLLLHGEIIDLGPKLTEETGELSNAPLDTKPVWTIDGDFAKALLAHDETASGLVIEASGAGESIRSLHTSGNLAGGGRFDLAIAPAADGRHLTVRASDAGRFLHGTDTTGMIQGGKLSADAVFTDTLRLHPAVGQAVIEGCVVRNSPLIGKLLQAVTVYGLVDALRGPGMRFSELTVPFRYEGNDLIVKDAVASNPSLGLTASGRIGLHSKQIAMNGTLVPAYFFNAIPGQIPLVGKLFSPETGGGLFSTRFSLSGTLDETDVTVNPISTLTPGFLRDIFGIFNRSKATEASPPAQVVPH